MNHHNIDTALVAAIAASSVATPTKPKRYGRQLIPVAFGDDSEVIHAAADKPLVKAFDYINTRAAQTA
jgi:hypothetical protein